MRVIDCCTHDMFPPSNACYLLAAQLRSLPECTHVYAGENYPNRVITLVTRCIWSNHTIEPISAQHDLILLKDEVVCSVLEFAEN